MYPTNFEGAKSHRPLSGLTAYQACTRDIRRTSLLVSKRDLIAQNVLDRLFRGGNQSAALHQHNPLSGNVVQLRSRVNRNNAKSTTAGRDPVLLHVSCRDTLPK